MERCPVCAGHDCECPLKDTVEFVRALIRANLEHLAANRSALLERIENLGPDGSTREDLDRLNGLIHRLWIRFLALEDFDEEFERALYRAHNAARAREADGLTIEQRLRARRVR
jgi:hypothetical protein